MPFTDDPITVVAIGAVAVFLGYGLFAITAFGAAIIAVPIITHVLPLSEVLPVTVMLDLAAASTLGLRARADADRSELYRLVPFSLIGAVLGVTLLVSLPRRAALLSLGVFLLLYAAWSLAEGGRLREIGPQWAASAGLVGGAMGTVFGVGGPPYVMYLSRRLADATRLRATIAVMIALSVAIRLVVFAAAGLMTVDRLVLAVTLAPFAACGFWLGSRVQRRVPRAVAVRLLNLLLLVLGASLLSRALLTAP
jgi:uncharacterized membrane protein YfcA